MYIEEIDIENYGCIEKFNYKFKRNASNNPVSLVIVGKNGTGKTLLISNLIDALVELKRKIYTNGIMEVNDKNYYKVGSLQYIKNKANTSKVSIKTSFDNNIVNYIDIMSRKPQEALKNKEIDEEEIDNKQRFEETSFSKKIQINNLKAKDFEKEILLYFPSDRYYSPMWYNSENYNRINYDSDKYVGKSRSNFIKIDVLENIHNWILDIFCVPEESVILIPQGDSNVPKKLWGKHITIAHNIKIQKQIREIFNIIIGEKCDFIMPSRKNKKIGLVGKNINCRDISQLSTGETFLYGMALSILKEWDLEHDNFELEDIKGCVIIDEIDVGFHIDYCYKVVPKLMALFPNIQFIITTHSPFLLAGLNNEFKNKIDIINMPNGEILNDINAFEEMSKAYEVLEIETNKIVDLNQKLIDENKKLRNVDNKIMIYTEGKTDIQYLKLALEKISGYEDLKQRIQFYDIGEKTKLGDSELNNIYEYLQKGNDNNIKICIFDRDNPKYIISDKKFEKGLNKVYKFCIPTPSNRNDDDLISIEHYLKDEELTTKDDKGRRMFLAKEFSQQGIDKQTHQFMCRYIANNSKKQGYHPLLIIDGNDDKKVYKINDDKAEFNYALSKENFVTNIEDGIYGFDNFDFSEFRKIFDIINEIVENEKNK